MLRNKQIPWPYIYHMLHRCFVIERYSFGDYSQKCFSIRIPRGLHFTFFVLPTANGSFIIQRIDFLTDIGRLPFHSNSETLGTVYFSFCIFKQS